MKPSTPQRKHLLTILVEDYFHVGAFGKLIQQQNWSRFETRYEENTRKVLDILDEFGTKATFFVLGWIAEQNPKLVREIAARGHEVASRGYYHRGLENLAIDEFREDVRRTNRVLEDACGQQIVGYRAAEKLSYSRDARVLDVLAEEGIVYDASFLPVRGDERAKRFAQQVSTSNGTIWEFPYSTADVGLGLVPISGGNYFRQFPYTLMRKAVRRWHEREDAPFVFYFHVWELDPEQPRISAASSYNRIRHYRKLDKMEWILKENLGLYQLTTVADHLGLEPETRAAGAETPAASEVIPSVQADAGNRQPVTIVVPCFNEEQTLPYLANTLRSVEGELAALGYEMKLLFIDDASTDRTSERIEEIFGGWENVRLIRHVVNKGIAAGIMTGLQAAETEIVCSIDCDCTYDPHELVRMVPMLTEGVDLVTASQYHRLGGVRNVPWWRLLLSKGASVLYRQVLGAKLHTYTSCFRVYRRSSMIGMPPVEQGFLGVAEMLARLVLAGGKVVEHPTVLETRLFGASKMKTARTVLNHLGLLARLAKERMGGREKVTGDG